MNVSVHCREERCIGNAWYIALLNTEFHLCGWLPSCLYTCNLPFLRLHSISPCLLRQVRVKDKDCGRSPRQVESHQVAIRCLIKFFSSSLRILIFDWTCSPASGPRSWETGLGPFPLLEPDSQGRFLQSATSIIFHGNLYPSINRFFKWSVLWSVYRPPCKWPLQVSNHCTGRSFTL